MKTGDAKKVLTAREPAGCSANFNKLPFVGQNFPRRVAVQRKQSLEGMEINIQVEFIFRADQFNVVLVERPLARGAAGCVDVRYPRPESEHLFEIRFRQLRKLGDVEIQ